MENKISNLTQSQSIILTKINNYIKNYENFDSKILTNSLILVFNKEKEKDYYINSLTVKKESFFSTLTSMLFPFLKRNNHYYYKNYDYQAIPKCLKEATVERAPEPSDLLWENFEFSDDYRKKQKNYSVFISFLLVLLTFSTVLAVNLVQLKYKLKKNKVYSMLISIIISLFNWVINKKLFNLTM